LTRKRLFHPVSRLGGNLISVISWGSEIPIPHRTYNLHLRLLRREKGVILPHEEDTRTASASTFSIRSSQRWCMVVSRASIIVLAAPVPTVKEAPMPYSLLRDWAGKGCREVIEVGP
jgi:hypothetical protein